MNVMDSSGWIEYFADGPNANFFEGAILNTRELIVPSICIFEVFKSLSATHGEEKALSAVAVMSMGWEAVVELRASYPQPFPIPFKQELR